MRLGLSTPLYRDYHDNEWGRPVRGRVALFERMMLEAFQSGLSWLVILRKRENFRRAFDGFDIETVAAYSGRDVDRLMGDEGIVRNRAKIEAAIANAQVAADLDVDLSDLLWSYAPGRRARPVTLADVPARTPESRPGPRPQAARLSVRGPHHRLRADAGDRHGG